MKKSVSTSGAVLGIIGSVFALLGGINLVLCADLLSALGDGSYVWPSYVFGIGSAVVGLIGSVLDFNKATVGGVLLLVATGMVVAAGIMVDFIWASYVAIAFLAVAALLSFFSQHEKAN